MKTRIILIIITLLFFGCENRMQKSMSRLSKDTSEMNHSEISELTKVELPVEYILDVPFVMQAPFANWSVHNESCEEAGILLPHYFYLGNELSPETADQELLDMVEFQKKYYGGEYDIYAEEMGTLAKDYYGYDNYRVIDGTSENIKSEIIKGNPVIVPTTAAYLKPEKGDYPEMGYHVVVVVGYNEKGFVTHDPGTYSGEDFTYSYSTLQKAMNDYNSKVLVLK